MTLGGYDASKFTPNDIVWQFNTIDIRDLTVQIDSITTTTTANSTPTFLLPSTIPAFLDSALPYLWLPAEACTLFEETFHLVWDNTTELYLVNDTLHGSLLTLNPNITFTLGNLTSGFQINITLPYSAFDLTVSTSLVQNSTYYFPLKRGSNDTQYVLGRTFFQEAYVIADYERRQFSVSPCKWDSGATEDIVTIYPPRYTSSNSTTTPANTNSDSSDFNHLGLVLGIVFGAIFILASSLALYCLIIKPKKRADAAKKKAEDMRWKASTPPMLANRWQNLWGIGAELDNQDGERKYEIDGGDNGNLPVWVVESDMAEREVFELPAREEVACELRGEGGIAEMEIDTKAGGGLGLGLELEQDERNGSKGWWKRHERSTRHGGGEDGYLPASVDSRNLASVEHKNKI